MLTDRIFLDQIERLEAVFSMSIAESAVGVWRSELNKIGIDDEDLVAGIDAIIHNSGKISSRPHLGTLIEWCGKAKDARVYEAVKKETEAHKKMTLSNVTTLSDHGAKSLQLIRAFLTGKLDKRQKVDCMLEMDKIYPGQGWAREAMKMAKEFKLE